MNLKTKDRLIKYIFLLGYIVLMISAIINKWNIYTDFGWFKFAFTAPYIELVRLLNRAIPFQISFLIAFIGLLIPMTFIIKGVKNNIKNFFLSYKEIMKVFASKEIEANDRVEKYFEIFNKYDTGILKVFFSLFLLFTYMYFLRTFFGILFIEQMQNFMNISSYELFWFDLKKGENIPILFILYILLTFILTTILFAFRYIKLKKENLPLEKYQEEKHLSIYKLLVSYSLYTLSLYLTKVSVPFALFIIILQCKNLPQKIKNNGFITK